MFEKIYCFVNCNFSNHNSRCFFEKETFVLSTAFFKLVLVAFSPRNFKHYFFVNCNIEFYFGEDGLLVVDL